jgi:hypothetical protein
VPIDPASLPRLSISLGHGDTDDEQCRVSPVYHFEQFTTPNRTYPGYGELEVNVSLLRIPDDVEKDYFGIPDSYWLRQKVRRARKLGYEYRQFLHDDYIDDLYEINTSKEQRQGRAMSAQYRDRPPNQVPFPTPTCPRHRNDYVGVFLDGKLYAYALIVQCGEMMLYSMILGHGDHMDNGIMNLLVYESVKWNRENCGTRYAIYYLADSGTEGLQFFKRKMGFSAHTVRWELSRRNA